MGKQPEGKNKTKASKLQQEMDSIAPEQAEQ